MSGAHHLRNGTGRTRRWIRVAALLATLLTLPILPRPAHSGERETLEARIVGGPALSDLTAYALLSSPMVGAARAQWRAAVEKYRVDTAWENPEVMVEGMYMTEGLGDRLRPDDWLVRFTQGVPLPGKLGAAGRIAEADARIGRLRVDGAARDLVVALRESFHELLYTREAKRIATLHRDLSGRLVAAGEGAYAANRAAFVDVMKAQAQSGQLLYDTILLSELEQTEVTRLNGLLNRPSDAAVGPLVEAPLLPLAYDLPEIRAFAEGGLEEIRIAGEAVGRAESMAALSRYENLPELNLGVSGGEEGGERQVGAQVGVMLPIWFEKNAGRAAGAKADLEAMRAMKESRVNETRAMVSDTFFRLRNAERLVRLYRDDLLPQAARGVERAEELYRQRQGSFSDYVETQAAWYSFQLSLARAKADHGKFLARLESLAGRSLTARDGLAGAEGAPGDAPPVPAGPAAAPDDFDGQAEKVRSLAAAWERALASPAPEESFLVPDAALLARMKTVAADDDATAGALSGRFSLEELESLALLRNPAAAAKERELRAVLEGYGQAESLDTVLRRYSSFTASLMTGLGPTESPEAMEASRFPFPGILALKGQVVTQDARAVREEVEKARRSAVTAVRKGYWEILWLRDARKTMEEVHQLLEGFRSAATGRYSAGEGGYQDAVKVAVELEKVKEEHLTMDGMQANAEAMIRETLALPPSTALGSPADARRGGDLPDLAALQAKARERRQEIRGTKAMIGKMERMVEMQETMGLPSLVPNRSMGGRDDVSRVGAAAMGEASAPGGLPKNPFFGMEEGYVRELRMRVEALKEELRMEEAASDLAVREAWFRLEKAKREEALYADRVVTLSRGALESSNRGYAAGKTMFADVIEAYRAWFEAELSRSRGRSDVGTAWAELEEAVGTSLPARESGGGAP